MGMFTRVVHPETGAEIQIQTGDDDLETYRLGDTVEWHIDTYVAGQGTLLDGVYWGCGYPDPDAWVVIKDHKIHAVRDIHPGEAQGDLQREYGIEDPDPGLWPEEAWERKRKWREEWEEKNKEFEKSISHLSPKGQLAQRMIRPLLVRRDYSSLVGKVFTVTPIEKK